jgi:heme A synthase
VYRSLAAWAETTVGVFHRCVSVVMFAAAVGLCMVALWRRSGEAGSAWVAGGLLVGVVLIIQRVQMILRVVRSN